MLSQKAWSQDSCCSLVLRKGGRLQLSCYAATTHPCILRWELTVRVLGQQSIVSARVLASLAAAQLLALPFAGVLHAGEALLRSAAPVQWAI